MQEPVFAVALLLTALAIGWLARADPFVLHHIGEPSDQHLLAYRNSAYAHVSWVVSPSDNVAELRFFNRVEGGVCLEPTWDDLQKFNHAGQLDHLVPPEPMPAMTGVPDARWPTDLPVPNPGTLSRTRYPCVFPAGLLLNNHLFDDPAAAADWRQASFDCLVVGLGSGVGVSLLLHHFPNASITVVDIDQVVIDMVREYYPMFDWLAGTDATGPITSDGRRRLRLVAQDARQYVSQSQKNYDLIILDAYTSGSTIPPHLMTREFFADLADHLGPGGIVLSNIIGSYTGEKHTVLTGAMRTFQAAPGKDGTPAFPSVLNFPLLNRDAELNDFREDWPRNNILLAGTESLTPRGNPSAWQRLQKVVDGQQLYEHLPRQTYMTRSMMGVGHRGQRYSTAMVPLDSSTPLWQALAQQGHLARGAPHWRSAISREPGLLRQAAEYAQDHLPESVQFGWQVDKLSAVEMYEVDLVATARMALQSSVTLARQTTGSLYTHGAERLVGPSDLNHEERAKARWLVDDAPLFTDQRMNADLYTD